MAISEARSVGEMAVEVPGATRIFEKLGVDYCCGGEKTLHEACVAVGVPVRTVIGQLEEAERCGESVAEFKDWNESTIGELVTYIVNTHHVFTRSELDRLEGLIAKVCSVHGHNHPELISIQELLADLRRELLVHMQKEEMVLFPYIHEMDRAAATGAAIDPPFFGTVRNPIRMMLLEHDSAGEMLKRIRSLSSSYSVPADGCASYQALYQALEALEADLHLHIHLENNILFPKAVDMENV